MLVLRVKFVGDARARVNMLLASVLCPVLEVVLKRNDLNETWCVLVWWCQT